MKITLLGTGDAIGTPKVNCSCPRCSHALRFGLQRLRTSLLVEGKGGHILVDSSPDLRQQLLLNGSPHISAVIWTHGHYDHFMGFGEFYRVQKVPDVFAAPPVMEYCGGIFGFLSFMRHYQEPYQPFSLAGLTFTLVEVNHPPAYTCGLLIEGDGFRVGFTSDTRIDLPERTLDLLEGVDLLLVDALVPPEYHIDKHMNYQDALELAKTLKVKDYRCVHISHNMPWDLPNLGVDGESFCFP
jgi:phosphoribosyl 1,2-cyclic phosphate phosphodiesterase